MGKYFFSWIWIVKYIGNNDAPSLQESLNPNSPFYLPFMWKCLTKPAVMQHLEYKLLNKAVTENCLLNTVSSRFHMKPAEHLTGSHLRQ